MKQVISKLFNFLYLKCLIFIPIIVSVGLGLLYVCLLINSPFLIERERVLFGIDIVSASLSGLSFYASYGTKDEEKKKIYYVNAERFLHAAILMSVAMILEGGVIILGSYDKIFFFKNIILFALISSTVMFFFFGLYNLLIGLYSMMKNMYLKAGRF